jgi:hypothetical protein
MSSDNVSKQNCDKCGLMQKSSKTNPEKLTDKRIRLLENSLRILKIKKTKEDEENGHMKDLSEDEMLKHDPREHEKEHGKDKKKNVGGWLRNPNQHPHASEHEKDKKKIFGGWLRNPNQHPHASEHEKDKKKKSSKWGLFTNGAKKRV